MPKTQEPHNQSDSICVFKNYVSLWDKLYFFGNESGLKQNILSGCKVLIKTKGQDLIDLTPNLTV